MKAHLEPTPELFDAPINGVKVPVRIWAGRTDSGIAIEAYVLAITPEDPSQSLALRAWMPPFMHRSSETFTVDLSPLT